MTTRDRAPKGSPCWVDLWTSDVEGSRRFYSELFGWEAAEPEAEFGGYWMFLRDGQPVAGGMGPMGDAAPDNRWKPYFQVDDAARAVATAQSSGATASFEPMPVADLGIQSVLTDPTGATFGVWQPGSFHGFPVLNEDGTPSWFELHTPGFDRAIEFYTTVLGWQTDVVSDSDEMRYRIVRDADRDGHVAGVLDSTAIGSGPAWYTYWEADDVDATVERATKLGATLVRAPMDTPYGRLAQLADPAGAPFHLRKG